MAGLVSGGVLVCPSDVLIVNVMESIEPDVTSDEGQLSFLNHGNQHVTILLHLLLLLPPSCHPAILCAHCKSISMNGSLMIPPMRFHPSMDDSCHTRSSATMCMLAAASVFAQGNPALIWHPAAHPDALPAPLIQFPTTGFCLRSVRRVHTQAASRPSFRRNMYKRPRSDEPELAQDKGLVVPVNTSSQLTRLALDLTQSAP